MRPRVFHESSHSPRPRGPSLLSFDLHNFLLSLTTPHFVAPTSVCPFAWLIPTHPWGLSLHIPSSRRKSSLTYSSLGCKCPQCGDHGCIPRTQSSYCAAVNVSCHTNGFTAYLFYVLVYVPFHALLSLPTYNDQSSQLSPTQGQTLEIMGKEMVGVSGNGFGGGL